MKNRIASLFLVFALLMSLCVNAGARDNPITVQSGGAERFTDVPTSHWAYGYINKVVGSGLFNGKTPTTFEPSSAMTRSQFVLVMARMEGRNDLEGVETQTVFPDVAPTRLAAGPIQWANEQGFVLGFGDGTFKPDSPITRGQFAALIHRYITAKGYENLNVVDPEPDQFTDAASVSTAFTVDVEYARLHGLLTGYSDGTVRSGNPITRAAIAAILARFLDLVGESVDPVTGQNYVPLLDYPRDSGDSGNTTPVDVPSSYNEVKVKVNGGTHGATPTVAITRNGATVAADDVKPGDRVTVYHKPQSGYVAVVRVRDANNKTVSVTRVDSDSSWFIMPSAMPVTVTVTYNKESSGGGGGGGGGNYNGGSSAPPSNPGNQNQTYSLTATANVVPTDGTGGYAYVIGSPDAAPAANYQIPANEDDKPASKTFSVTNNTQASTVSAYAIFVPEDGYRLDSVSDGTNNLQILNTATTKVQYVDISKAGNIGTPATVTVTGTFVKTQTPSSNDDNKPKISVSIVTEAKWAENHQTTVSGDPANDITLTSSSDKNAQPGQEVKVEVPRYAGNDVSTRDGYFRYEFNGNVNAVYKATDSATGTPVTVTESTLKDDYTYEYSFTVPENVTDGSTITLTASYDVAATKTLTYKFKTAFKGDGTANGKATVSAPGFTSSLELTAANTTEKPMTIDMLAYVQKYPARDTATGPWAVPFNIGASVTSTDSTYEDDLSATGSSVKVANDDGAYEAAKLNNGSYELNNDDTATISATFTKVDSEYGFKLTVIGKGTSTASFTAYPSDKDNPTGKAKGFEKTAKGSDTTPDTVTARSFSKTAPTALTLTNAQTDSNWELDSVTVNGNKETPSNSMSINLTEDKIDDITVIFKDKTAVPVRFKVTSVNGTTNVKAENGKILPEADASNLSGDLLKNKVDNDGINTANNPEQVSAVLNPSDGTYTPTEKYYYAMSGTIITLTNGGDNTQKIKKIDQTLPANSKDIFDTEGYSFALKKADEKELVAEVAVTFGEAGPYELMVTAPVKTDWADIEKAVADRTGSFHAFSFGIDKNASLKAILNSLNDNNVATDDAFNDVKQKTADAAQLENSFAPTFLGSVVTKYVENDNGKDKKLETMLNDSVADILKTKLPGIVDGKAAEVVSKLDTIVDDQLTQYPDTLVNAPLSNQMDNATITDFVTKAFANTSGYNANDTFIADTTLTVQVKEGALSLKQQLTDALKQYATFSVDGSDENANIQVSTASLKTKIHVKPNDTAKTLTISAEVVDATDETQPGKPTIDEKKMQAVSAFLNPETTDPNAEKKPFDLYVTVKANLYKAAGAGEVADKTFEIEIDGQTQEIPCVSVGVYNNVERYSSLESLFSELVSLYNKAHKDETDFTPKAMPTVNADTIKTLVGNSAKSEFEAEWKKATKNIQVDMTQALDDVTLNKVVYKMLDDGLKKLTDRVNSLPEGAPQTTPAFRNLYGKLVTFVGETDKYLILEPASDNNILATIETDPETKAQNLVINLDLEKLFGTGNASFEQLVSLLEDFRTGFAADLQSAGAKPESVIADLLANRLVKRAKVVKWGSDPYTVEDSKEGREVAELLAKLIMSENLNTTTLESVWTGNDSFEKHGYQLVAFSVGFGESADGDGQKPQIYKAFKETLDNLGISLNTLEDGHPRAGFLVGQTIK